MTADLGRIVVLARRRQRWDEYRRYLEEALRRGYAAESLESWLTAESGDAPRLLLLRHDVDRDATTAWRMCSIEERLGLTSTFYFRWASLDTDIASRMHKRGFAVGLHYETLTRYALEHALTTPDSLSPQVISECRTILKREIETFRLLVGVCDTVAAHGDPVAEQIGATNEELLRGEEYGDYGIRNSADDPSTRLRIQQWVSDGSGVPRYWSAGHSLNECMAAGVAVILFNSHPHHWESGLRIVGRRTRDMLATGLRERTSVAVAEATAWNRWAGARAAVDAIRPASLD